eukprot:TRINITY_DN725_c0_g1_i3.p1 TRINITY_DN725_c0_g1~~TRINITY_DN725_c0_g1_i3.p1  ORF type:complete len:400 (+),score=65.15 TRINITY_DN725_c0_g1_i3:183-1382(+)
MCIRDSFNIQSNKDFLASRNQLVDLIWDIGDKLKLQINTIHLAIYFQDYVSSKMSIAPSKYQVYAASSVLVAAKAIELDQKIPFITKLKRYSGLSNQVNEFKDAEMNIVKLLKWNLQCVTLIDLLEYYLPQGIIYSSDYFVDTQFQEENVLKEKKLNFEEDSNQQIKNIVESVKDLTLSSSQQSKNKANSSQPVQIKELNNAKIFQLVSKLDREYLRIANFIIRDSSFSAYNQRILACAAIAFLRKIIGIINIWNLPLQNLSDGIKIENIEECYLALMNKFQQYFIPINGKYQEVNSQSSLTSKQQPKVTNENASQSASYTNGSQNLVPLQQKLVSSQNSMKVQSIPPLSQNFQKQYSNVIYSNQICQAGQNLTQSDGHQLVAQSIPPTQDYYDRIKLF